MNDFKKEDLFFQIPALTLWIIILIVSFSDLNVPVYTLITPMTILGVIIFLLAMIFRIYAVTTLN